MKVAIVHLGREQALGERRRVESWARIFDAAGVTCVQMSLRLDAAASVRHPPDIAAIARGDAAFESGAWSASRARTQLAASTVDATVFITTRAFHPSVARVGGRPIIDFVDPLSGNYEDRASVERNPAMRLALRVLARRQRRLENTLYGYRRVSAGREDAARLGATWIPNVIEPVATGDRVAADHDVIFFGTLSYPPNIDAIEYLSEMWPAVELRRPGTTLLVAGARPTTRVRELIAGRGWTLQENFDDLGQLLERARISVVPLRLAAGIQNKVLEAAAHGLAQVVTPEAVAGLPVGWPGPVAHRSADLVSAIANLLDDEGARSRVACDQRSAIRKLEPAAWSAQVLRLLSEPSGS